MMARYGFWIGVSLFLFMQWLPAPSGLTAAGWDTAALTVLMGIWWFTEAVPIPLTGSLPFIILPVLGVQSAGDVSANYMSPVHFLVIGGAMLGLATEKCGLHRRLALFLISSVKPTPPMIVFAVMLATATISMVVSNSATVIMMLPIATAIVTAIGHEDAQTKTISAEFASALFIGIAIASNMGGFVTPVGTPVNPVIIELAARLFEVEINFAQWIAFCLPLIVIALPLAWLVITHSLRRQDSSLLKSLDLIAVTWPQGALTVPEKRTLVVVAVTSLLWIGLPLLREALPGVSSATVAMVSALSLCLLPSGARTGLRASAKLLEWKDCARAPWFLVFLLGGGLALADAVVVTGLSDWIGSRMRWISILPLPAVLLAVSLICIAVTECASQVGTATTFMPIVAVVAVSGGYDPLPIALAAGLGASWGMANPAGTSSNAMAMASGHVPVSQFVAVGAVMDIIGALLIAASCLVLAPLVING